MDVTLKGASNIVDAFERLMCDNGISIPRHPLSQDDMLPFWHLLRTVAQGFSGTANELRPEFTAAVAAHDLAAKVLEVSRRTDIGPLLPHLRMLNEGAVHLTTEPPGDKDVFNKLIELYWACLLSIGRCGLILLNIRRGLIPISSCLTTVEKQHAAMRSRPCVHNMPRAFMTIY